MRYVRHILNSLRKNNCQKILTAHSMITKRDLILRGNSYYEKYIYIYIYYVVLGLLLRVQ